MLAHLYLRRARRFGGRGDCSGRRLRGSGGGVVRCSIGAWLPCSGRAASFSFHHRQFASRDLDAMAAKQRPNNSGGARHRSRHWGAWENSINCSGRLRQRPVVSKPPGLGLARQPIHIHVFYSNHFQQTKTGMRASPTAQPSAAVRGLGHAEVAGQVIHHDGAIPSGFAPPIPRPRALGRQSTRWRKGRREQSLVSATASSVLSTA